MTVMTFYKCIQQTLESITFLAFWLLNWVLFILFIKYVYFDSIKIVYFFFGNLKKYQYNFKLIELYITFRLLFLEDGIWTINQTIAVNNRFYSSTLFLALKTLINAYK